MKKRIAIVLMGIIVVVLGRGAFYYSGFYSPPPSKIPSYEHIAVPPAPSAEFSENVSEGKGTILVDFAHDNTFDIGELNVLMLRLVSRGLTIKLLGMNDDLKKALSSKEGGEEVPKSFIIVCPQKEFSGEEKKAIQKFVSDGARLLLVAEPTRPSKINNTSLEFGMIFEPGYLYNLKENEINYRNIFITEFNTSDITKNLKKIALYVSGSISSADDGIAFVDQDTFSSLIESRKRLSPIALTEESKVLGVYDLTFMSEPYNSVLDNNQFISNIADWLASSTEKE